MDAVPIARLEDDWRRALVTRELAAGFRRWQLAEPALRSFPDPAALLRFLRASSPGERQDRVLRALLASANDDPEAARVVLHALLPGLKRLSSRLLSDVRDQEELWATLLGAAWARIREYPLDRRPRRVAANVLLDTMHDAVVARRRTVRDRSELDLLPGRELTTTPNVDGDVDDLLARAVQAGAVTSAEAELILRTRIDGVQLKSLAWAQGVSYDALRVRRRRAERRLLMHLGARNVRSDGADALLGRARVAERGPAGPAGGSDQSSH